jgi:hypothetical protein
MTANIEAARALYARTLKEQFVLGTFNMDNQETLLLDSGVLRSRVVREG